MFLCKEFSAMKKHNFSAGPCILPDEVMQQAAQAVQELDGSGLSLIEISHRSAAFIEIMDKACTLVLGLLGLTDKGYKALFLQGGASTQFLATAYNLLENKGAYLNTGTWSTKAINEAKLLGEVVEVASSADANFNYIPKEYSVPADVDYLHITTNNTIFGTQIKTLPETDAVLASDSSSDIFSRQLDFSKFGILYAGAQKNMGPAGTTLVVVKEELLGKVTHKIPSMLDYALHSSKDSMFNTPSVFAVYVSMLTLEWLKDLGGKPVKLGLDLSGGVHFLLEVDIDTAKQGRLELLLDTYRKTFKEDRIAFSDSSIKDLALHFKFRDQDSYNKALKKYRNDSPGLTGLQYIITERPSSNTLILEYSDVALREIRD